MTILANFPAIRPSLLLDFANSKVLDPRITFGRASAATYYDGKTVAKAEENLLLNSAILATQSVTTRAEPYTLSFIGTGTVTLSGSSSAGPLVGTGAANRVTLTFTPTTGTLTLTVSGAVEQAQLEARSSATAYTPTTTQPTTNYMAVLQTAAANAARFDHHPVTGESLGLLIEEQRTNLFMYSEFGNDVSGVGGVTASSMFGPGGDVVNAAYYGYDGLTAGYIYKGSSVANTQYTLSVYVKMSDGFSPSFGGTAGSSSLNDFTLVLAGGLINPTTYSITHVGNGLYRVSGTSTTGTTNLNNNGVNKYAGNSPRTFKVTGWQLEAGAFPTSYIKTESSQVTRSVDSVSMIGANFSSWYRQDEGTLFAAYKSGESVVTQAVFTITDGSLNGRLGLYNDIYTAGGITTGFVVNAAGASSIITTQAASAIAKHKITASYKAGDYSCVLDAGTSAASSFATLPVVNRADIGSALGNTALLNGHIQKIAYYPKALPSSLQSIAA